MYKLLFLITIIFLVSCRSGDNDAHDHKESDHDSTDIVDVDSTDTIEIISDYNFDGVDPKMIGEFKASLAKIEQEHGAQWDFCTCVIKNDSIDKAFKRANLPDKEFDRLFERSNVIEDKCQAFLAQNPSTTPDERALHAKKVRNCLKAAGLK